MEQGTVEREPQVAPAAEPGVESQGKLPDDAPCMPIQMTMHMVKVVERWPERTQFPLAYVEDEGMRHLIHGTVDDNDPDTITVHVSNGAALYRLRRDLPTDEGYVIADLEDADTPETLKERSKQYEAVQLPPGTSKASDPGGTVGVTRQTTL